jgi:hypothetical protein
VAFLEQRSNASTSFDDDTNNYYDTDSTRYPILEGGSNYSADSDEEETSLFRGVLTPAIPLFRKPPSPEGNGIIDEILGPPPSDDSRDSGMARKTLSTGRISMGPQGATQAPPAGGYETRKGVGEEDPFIHTVTVYKHSQPEKIGIYVGLKRFAFGTRLVVSRVAPDGKFADSGVEVGDIVVSINGKSFLENPNSQDAFGKFSVGVPDEVGTTFSFDYSYFFFLNLIYYRCCEGCK